MEQGMDWQRIIGSIAAEVEHRVDRVRTRVGQRGVSSRRARVVPYRGYGTAATARVRGRVLRGAAPTPATPEDRWWVNLANAYRRLESDEVPGARIRVRFRGAEVEAVTDEEGHFDVPIHPLYPLAPDRLWHDAAIQLLEPEGDDVSATISVPTDARFGVISDLDDTVLHTDATNLLRMAREVLFGNVHTRIPFPGVGAFYRALHRGDSGRRNPLFYVSSSPWNLYDLLAEFLRLHHLPAGPMELRDWGFSRREVFRMGHRDHKRKAIDRIFATYPDLPFILVGDSGQEDPEIYRELVADYPGRIPVIYIRNVVQDPQRIEAVHALGEEARMEGAELLLTDDTRLAAEHAAAHGWIDPAALEGITRARDIEREESGD